MILSVHIRKCAGTSFRRSLAAAYGDAVLFDYGDQVGSSWPSSVKRRADRQAQLAHDTAHLKRYELIHGHFYPQKYDGLDRQKRYITFLRDPVTRLASNYAYLQRQTERRHPDALIVQQLGFSLEEFARHPDNRNFQTHCLQGLTLDDLAFVGLVERYGQDLVRLSDVLGIALPECAPKNANPDTAGGYDLSARERGVIEDCNRDDLALYDAALRRADTLAMV